MVSEKVVLETIARMKQAGLSDDLIIGTLTDVGLSEAEARAYLNKQAGGIIHAKAQEPRLETQELTKEKPKSEELHEKIAEKTASRLKEHLIASNEEHIMLAQNTQAALEEHKDKLESIEEKLSSLEKSGFQASGISQQDMLQLKDSIDALKKEVAETKALASATKSLMEKILDVNRQILAKL